MKEYITPEVMVKSFDTVVLNGSSPNEIELEPKNQL